MARLRRLAATRRRGAVNATSSSEFVRCGLTHAPWCGRSSSKSSGRRSQALSGVGRGPRSTPDNSGACAHSALRSIISSDSAASWMCRRQVYASRHSMSSSTSACSRFSSATDDGSEYSAARTSPMSLSISQIHGIVRARRDHAERNSPALRTVPALPMVTSMDAAVTRNQGEAGPVLVLPSPRELRGRKVHQASLAALARPCEDHHISLLWHGPHASAILRSMAWEYSGSVSQGPCSRGSRSGLPVDSRKPRPQPRQRPLPASHTFRRYRR